MPHTRKLKGTEFVRLAHQAVVALGSADMINRAELRACGHSRSSRRLDRKGQKRMSRRPGNQTSPDSGGRAPGGKAGFQPYWLCGVISYVAQGQERPVWRASDPLSAPHK